MAATRALIDEAAEIRARLAEWAEATRAKDIDRIMASCAADIVAFDCHTHLRLMGAEAYRKHLETCLPCIAGPLIFEMSDLEIAARDDLAFCHGLARCGATGPDGQEHRSWLRTTICLRKTNGRWMIVHGHLSAPFDPQSGKALLDLGPGPEERASAA